MCGHGIPALASRKLEVGRRVGASDGTTRGAVTVKPSPACLRISTARRIRIARLRRIALRKQKIDTNRPKSALVLEFSAMVEYPGLHILTWICEDGYLGVQIDTSSGPPKQGVPMLPSLTLLVTTTLAARAGGLLSRRKETPDPKVFLAAT